MPEGSDHVPGKRALDNFFSRPLTVWRASRAVATATLVVTVAGGFLVWIIDHDEFPNIGESLWWSLQTVTTVGYGDIVPHDTEGRIVGSILMVAGVGFLAVITASIASAFTQAALRRRGREEDGEDPVLARIDELSSRIERLEQAVRDSESRR
jgi:voltage-gated potassium channel